MKPFILWLFLLLSHSYAGVEVEFLNLTEHNEKLWELRVAITNHGADEVIINTGYLQHLVEFGEQDTNGQLYLLTEGKGTSINDVHYRHVPSVDEMKLVTLKKHQYSTITYKFEPDEEDRKMLQQIKEGKNFVVVYSSKDRDFSYSYWKGKITSRNFIALRNAEQAVSGNAVPPAR